VTVQLDAVQLGDVRVRPVAGGPRGPEADRPVFVDASGRRSRRFRRLGMAVALACAVYAVVIVATLMSGSSDAPWLPVPAQGEDRPAGKVDTSPLPRSSATPSSPGSAVSGTAPVAGDNTTAAPSDTARANRTGSAVAPGVSADPRPTATGTAKNPVVGGSSAPGAAPSTPASTTGSAPSSPAGGSATPSESASRGIGGGGGLGIGGTHHPLAGGQDHAQPIAQEQAADGPSITPSPEHNL
jgi:hypothetical protein